MFLKKYFHTYLIQIKNNFVREVVYRTNFLASAVVDIVWIAVELSLFGVIYANVTELGGWKKEQVYFFLGVFFSSDALFTTFLQTNFWRFSDLVNKGELDILLTKPIHPLFLALSRWINITNLSNFLLGLFITIKYAGPAGFPGGLAWIKFPFWLMIGCLSQLLMRFLFSIFIFWTERSFALARMYYQFFQFATKPDVIYPKSIRYLILTFLPFAFVSSVPTRALLGSLSSGEFYRMIGILVVFAIINAVLWKRGLRRYQSASS